VPGSARIGAWAISRPLVSTGTCAPQVIPTLRCLDCQHGRLARARLAPRTPHIPHALSPLSEKGWTWGPRSATTFRSETDSVAARFDCGRVDEGS
jgi:hypothetical protein